MYKGSETFGAIVEYHATENPYSQFIKFEDRDLTYLEFHESGNRAANALSSLELNKGDTCAVMLPNSPEFLAVWLGLTRLGVIEVPVNTEYRGALLIHVLNQAKCRALVISAQWLERVQEMAPELRFLKHIVIVGDAKDEFTMGQIQCYSYSMLMEKAESTPIKEKAEAHDPSLILFTSGTTGPSKGAILSHKANFTLAKTCCELMKYGSDDRLFTVFPLYHVNARYATVLAALVAGSSVVMHNRFSASKFWDICRREQITAFNYMGSLITILMKQPEKDDDAVNPVRMIQGAPCPAELYDAFQKRFNIKITEAYGSTELGVVTVNRAESFRKGSCGQAVPLFEIEIHDESDRPCPPHRAGEIVVRPKEPFTMFSGYYGMDEATVKCWQNLWFHTGDRGKMDEDGYFYFLDRKKDVVRRRGENISSYEVERVINDHPKVQESAVVGVPSELTEEEVLAVIVVKENETLEPEDLLQYCQRHLPSFSLPAYIRMVKEFPRTPSQRIEKYKLREEGVTEDTWIREAARKRASLNNIL